MRGLCIFFVAIQASVSLAAFFNPGLIVSWEIGENQTLNWTTEFKTYTIALWQQIGKGNAQTSPNALLYTTPAVGVRYPNHKLNWTVELYDFDLAVSRHFFFWVCEGIDSHPCSGGSQPNMRSPYFAIRNPHQDPTTTSTEATTSSAVTTRPTSSSTVSLIQSPAPTTTGGTPDTSTDSTTSSNFPPHSNSKTGLTKGPVAGVAVACTVVAIASVGALFLWYRHLRRKKEHMLADKQRRSCCSHQPDQSEAIREWAVSRVEACPGREPVELDGGGGGPEEGKGKGPPRTDEQQMEQPHSGIDVGGKH